MPILKRSIVALTALVVLATALPTAAQIPDEFTNLKMLPKDISKRELVSIMRSWSGALGVRCSFCHVAEDPADLESFDFASDDKEEKRASRIMMEMAGEINKTYLPKLEHEGGARVRCITCHHGVPEPETIDDVVADVMKKDGLDTAQAKYRDLREEYYGRGAYDFSAGPLNALAERLAQEDKDVASAIAIVKLNIEFNPDEASSHMLLGQLYQASGDKAAAIASIEKSLELDPDNEWAKVLLEKIKSAD
jgi:tetratricopeptide (TPR) repeat protein